MSTAIPAGTCVKLKDGAFKSVNEIKEGDVVVGYNPVTSKLESHTIMNELKKPFNDPTLLHVETKKMQMNPVVKDKWVQALRLGNFSQITGQLCKESEAESIQQYPVKYRCVMGVLADIYMLDHPNAIWNLKNQLVITTTASRYIRRRVKNEDRIDSYHMEAVRHQSYEQREVATYTLPQLIMEWAGLEYRDNCSITQAGLVFNEEMYLPSALNDTHGLSFEALSNLIEAQL